MVTVLKFGGSVLKGESDLSNIVREVQRWLAKGGKVVAVVSAFDGTTDRLLQQARAYVPSPESDCAATSLLLATGELTTASLLTLALHKSSVDATVLSPAAIDLRTDGKGVDADPVRVDVASIRRALARTSVVVIPGFIGVDDARQFTLLGRGGSDLTALFLAHQLGAACRLVKDVDGLYDRDPAVHKGACRFDTVSWNDALQLDGRIVQHKAVRFARERSLPFEVGALGNEFATAVGPGQDEPEPPPGSNAPAVRQAFTLAVAQQP